MRIRPILCFFTILLLFGQSLRANGVFLPQTIENNACIDSVVVEAKAVRCNTYRDGEIRVKLVLGGTAPYYYSLDNQNFTTFPVFDRLLGGVYSLWVRDDLGCVWHDTVSVPEPAELQVHLTTTKNLVKAGELFQLKAVVSPADAVLQKIDWRPISAFERMDTLQQQARISQNTTFAIEIHDTLDCIARDQIDVAVDQTNLFFPNTFKPGSNDNGFFTVYAGEGVAQVVSLRVYDRWGGTVFENRGFQPNDPEKGWNGRFHGRNAMSGLYLWIAEIEYLDQRHEIFEGTIALINGEK